MRKFFIVMLGLMLTACQSTPPDTTPIVLSATKMNTVVLDTPYTSLVALTDVNLGPSPNESAFGPMINRYFLTDDFVVYQHLKVVEPFTPPLPDQSIVDQVLGSVDTPQPVTTQVFEQLTYFLVNPDGIVTDFASGRLAPNATRCIQVNALTELVSQCDDNALLERELASFDAIMRTSDGGSIAGWTVQESAPTPAGAAQQ